MKAPIAAALMLLRTAAAPVPAEPSSSAMGEAVGRAAIWPQRIVEAVP
jgi:hypothetical protein